jgi:hypothetical protein
MHFSCYFVSNFLPWVEIAPKKKHFPRLDKTELQNWISLAQNFPDSFQWYILVCGPILVDLSSNLVSLCYLRSSWISEWQCQCVNLTGQSDMCVDIIRSNLTLQKTNYLFNIHTNQGRNQKWLIKDAQFK